MSKSPDPAGGGRSVIVVGAGIVGTCCAVYLKRAGFAVTLIERDAPGEACSFGNAGSIGLTSFAPQSLPSLWRKIPAMMIDRKSALQVRPGQFPRSFPWFMRFLMAGRPRRVAKIIAARKALLNNAMGAFDPILAEAGAQGLIETHGKMFVYESERSYEGGAFDRQVRRDGGARIEELSGDEAREHEPALGPRVHRAVFLPDLGHCPNPLRLTQELVEHFVQGGGTLLKETVLTIEDATGAAPRVITETGRHEADLVVLAAGIWSRALAAQLGVKVPLESQRGYHMMLPESGVSLRYPVISVDRNALITPMELGIRVSGIAEHAGITAPPNYALADLVVEHARAVMPGLVADGGEPWSGHRPSTPDSLPVIGPAPGNGSVLLAYGHGHTGLTMGAITGRLISELAAGQTPGLDLTPYRADRF
jgi:D-amino-acid dehydrogenase